jgi:hypothetical protein
VKILKSDYIESNAARVLAEMGYMKALGTLKEHYNRDVPQYLKNSLMESIKNIGKQQKMTDNKSFKSVGAKTGAQFSGAT